ncbi:nucleoside deaminase [Lacticaseibacillus mingshuiensis]|uniref:nucleoside deaminase n=1 Tax=Lacticaseibacillus mingshuiensis TaxID=2799574 RepID=UPI0019503B73|nr:nucleoside deaminase [Lacticaseibacillus mingshuiensis]
MTYDKSFMAQAAKEAESNLISGEGGPFGCVIVKDGAILTAAHNQVLAQHDPTAHAEIMALRQAGALLATHDLSGCTLYSSAMPCPMCLAAIVWANIKTVYYGNAAEDAAAIGFRDAAIYDFIDGGLQNTAVLVLTQHDRELTIPAFHSYQNQAKQLY